VPALRWFRDRTSAEALARELCDALERAKDAGFSHVILDGRVIARDRCKEPVLSVKGEVIDLWYSGKAHAGAGAAALVLMCAGVRASAQAAYKSWEGAYGHGHGGASIWGMGTRSGPDGAPSAGRACTDAGGPMRGWERVCGRRRPGTGTRAA
jgi:hypothetical protein